MKHQKPNFENKINDKIKQLRQFKKNFKEHQRYSRNEYLRLTEIPEEEIELDNLIMISLELIENYRKHPTESTTKQQQVKQLIQKYGKNN